MKSSIIALAISTIGIISVWSIAANAGGPKVTICHIPPGNPGNAHEITVSVNALPAHLAHGDYEGACDPCVQDPTHPDCN